METQIKVGKQLRKNQKISISKKIAKIRKLILNKDDPRVIQEEVDKLQHKYAEAEATNSEIRELTNEEAAVENWILDVKQSMEECKAQALEYQNYRSDHKNQDSSKVDEEETTDSRDDVEEEKCKRESIIMERIIMLNNLLQDKTSGAKIKCLHDKLVEVFSDTKIWYKNSRKTRMMPHWDEKLELEMDVCSSNVMEYLETVNKHDVKEHQHKEQ